MDQTSTAGIIHLYYLPPGSGYYPWGGRVLFYMLPCYGSVCLSRNRYRVAP